VGEHPEARLTSPNPRVSPRETRRMKDVIVGIAAIVIGGVFCFWGYFAMRVVIPIWGFFAGFMLGAGATAWIDNSEFLSTVLGWILGFFIGLLFALIAYLFYEIAVVLAFAGIGFTFGSGLMTALNIDWNWFVILIGIAVGILFGIFAVVAQLPMAILVVFSTIAGALTMTAGLMLVFNALDTEDFSNDKVVDLIDDDWWWWVIAFALAAFGLVSQMKVITKMRWTARQAWDNSWRPGPPPAIA
jgi:hypothetical protein